jgi:hypothetical protein
VGNELIRTTAGGDGGRGYHFEAISIIRTYDTGKKYHLNIPASVAEPFRQAVNNTVDGRTSKPTTKTTLKPTPKPIT